MICQFPYILPNSSVINTVTAHFIFEVTFFHCVLGAKRIKEVSLVYKLATFNDVRYMMRIVIVVVFRREKT